MSLLTLGGGFPDGAPIPMLVGMCGDGIHVAFVTPGAKVACECGKMIVGPLRRGVPFARVVFPDDAMTDAAIGETRRFPARRARR